MSYGTDIKSNNYLEDNRENNSGKQFMIFIFLWMENIFLLNTAFIVLLLLQRNSLKIDKHLQVPNSR